MTYDNSNNNSTKNPADTSFNNSPKNSTNSISKNSTNFFTNNITKDLFAASTLSRNCNLKEANKEPELTNSIPNNPPNTSKKLTLDFIKEPERDASLGGINIKKPLDDATLDSFTDEGSTLNSTTLDSFTDEGSTLNSTTLDSFIDESSTFNSATAKTFPLNSNYSQQDAELLLEYTKEIISYYDDLILRLRRVTENIDSPISLALSSAFNDITNAYYLKIKAKKQIINLMEDNIKSLSEGK